MFAYNKIIVFTKGQYYISRHMNHNSIIVKPYDSKKQLSQYQFAYVLHESKITYSTSNCKTM